MAIGKSIEWLCMEDCHSVKLSRLLALTVLVLNGSLFRNLTTLVSYWASRSAFLCRGAEPRHTVVRSFVMPRGGATAYGSSFVRLFVCLAFRL